MFEDNVLGHHRNEALGVMGVEGRHHTLDEAIHKHLVDRCRFGFTSCHHHSRHRDEIEDQLCRVNLSRYGNAWVSYKSRRLPALVERTSASRCHHLLKTFYAGPGGWTDRQLPDGTVIFTSLTGHAYTTEPHGGMLFPALAQSTGETIPVLDEPTTNRALMMPTRKQTREQDRRDRATRKNRIHRRRTTTPGWLAANYDPPPF